MDACGKMDINSNDDDDNDDKMMGRPTRTNRSIRAYSRETQVFREIRVHPPNEKDRRPYIPSLSSWKGHYNHSKAPVEPVDWRRS